MISREDVENLAALSRLALAPSEIDALQHDFASILEYVGQVSAVDVVPAALVDAPLVNVMRDDVAVERAVGGTREALLGAFPRREGDYDVVRKIIEK